MLFRSGRVHVHRRMNPTPDFDPAAIIRLRRLGNAAFVREMIDLFNQLAAQKIQLANQALAAGDLTALANAVHPLKSSSGGVGAATMFELATRIEELSRRGETAPLPALVTELDAAFSRVGPLLQSARATIPP